MSGELLGVDGALPEGSILRKLPTRPWKLGLSPGGQSWLLCLCHG
jgi:hypothetical protein